MAQITAEQAGDGYQVDVTEGPSSTSHLVTVSAADLDRYGQGVSGSSLVEASIRFLLTKEPKESIMSRFDVSVIPTYFPDYEARIGEFL